MYSPKYKVSRTLGCNLWGREKDPFNFKNYFPGQHGQTVVRVMSNYVVRFRAKQKMRFYYNMNEKQFRTVFNKGMARMGDTVENFVGLLEQRLEICLYRSGFVPTIFAARQIISHKHVTVNGKVLNIRSALLKAGDVVGFTEKGKKHEQVLAAIAKGVRTPASYLNVNSEKMEFEYIRVPKFAEVPYDVPMEPNLVVEFYSR